MIPIAAPLAGPWRAAGGYRRRFPEWWLIAAIAACWVVICAHALGLGGTESTAGGASVGSVPSSHLHHPGATPERGLVAPPGLVRFLVDWSVMTVAMMLPIVIPAFRHVAFNSFRSRLRRSTAIFLGSFGLVWLGFGLAVALAIRLLAWWVPVGSAAYVVAGLFLVAAAWQLSPWKRRSLNACRRAVPLRPFGRAADVACARFGGLHGARCVVSCWAMMLAMAVLGHGNLVAAFGLTLIVVLEDRSRAQRAFLPWSAVALALGASAVLIA